MKVRDIMTQDPACCAPDATLQQVAQQMAQCDCGEIPVVDKKRLVGVVTDRDIVCRAVAKGKTPQQVRVRDVMTKPVITVDMDADLDSCCNVMESAQIRRVPVVDGQGGCCGIVSQADIACRAADSLTSKVVRDISKPSGGASRARQPVMA